MDKQSRAMAAVAERTDKAAELQRQLRKAVLAEIERRHLSNAELQKRLDLLPSGVQNLLERPTWPLDLAVRVAEAIDLVVELKAVPEGRK